MRTFKDTKPAGANDPIAGEQLGRAGAAWLLGIRQDPASKPWFRGVLRLRNQFATRPGGCGGP
jgi:hypothetical protein